MYPYDPTRTNTIIVAHNKAFKAFNDEIQDAFKDDRRSIVALTEMLDHRIALPLFEMRENGMTSIDGARDLLAQNLAVSRQEAINGGRFDGSSFEVVELTPLAHRLLAELSQKYTGSDWFTIFLEYIGQMHWAGIHRRLAVSAPVLRKALDEVDELTCFRIAEITTGKVLHDQPWFRNATEEQEFFPGGCRHRFGQTFPGTTLLFHEGQMSLGAPELFFESA